MNKNYPNRPVAYVTVKKNRQKVYGDSVYLNDKTEFELELFNPTSDVYLAKISLNGKSISNSGIILYPGKREYLERYIDEPRKFKFDTYEVEDSDEAKNATKNNGLVEVTFYKEDNTPPYQITYTNNTDYAHWIDPYNQSPTVGPYNNGITTGNAVYCSNNLNEASFTSDVDVNYLAVSQDSVETGRIDKGAYSNDKFASVDKTFEAYMSNQITYRIIPISQKNIVTDDIRIYCTSCGTKRRNGTWEFCPKCGTRYQ